MRYFKDIQNKAKIKLIRLNSARNLSFNYFGEIVSCC